MTGRETLELEPVTAAEKRTAGEAALPAVGVIGIGPGVGVTTVCRLLERENRLKGSPLRVLDLGEKKEPDFRPEEIAHLLVVADGRDGALPEGIWESIRPLKKTGTDIGFVVNRWSGPMRAPAPAEETDIPVFLIPELPPEAFTTLYRFVFGS